MNRSKKVVCSVGLLSILAAPYVAEAGIMNDSVVTTKVKAKYFNDYTLSGWKIKVKTEGDTVYLSGKANSNAQKQHAIEVAKDTDGATAVDAKDLKVERSVNRTKDSKLTAKVKMRLGKLKVSDEEPSANPLSVTVETVNQNVYLSGEVSSDGEADAAISAARDVAGVKSVTSFLTVNS